MTKPIIICVDDDAATLATVARLLRRDDREVRATESARDALVWIANEDVAVLISDYDMPEMTGAQLAAQVLQLRPEVVRVLLTGQRSLETALDGINQGEVFRFVTKPFSPPHLLAVVDAALARHRELLELTGARQRRGRRAALRASLEREFPGITTVARGTDGRYVVEPAGAVAAALGWDAFARALDD